MAFSDEFRDSKKNAGRTDHGPTDRRTDPHLKIDLDLIEILPPEVDTVFVPGRMALLSDNSNKSSRQQIEQRFVFAFNILAVTM